MMTVTPEHTKPFVVGHEGSRYTMTDYIGRHAGDGAEAGDDDGWQAYLVRQEAPELRAHFHEVDQFQVVLDGEGTLGRAAARRGVVHYTDAFTSYGPIRTDPEVGLAYFTLRRRADVGIHYMPEERDRLRARRGQHFTVALDRDGLPSGRLHPVERSGRGAAAYGIRLEPGDGLVETAPIGEGYLIVLDGVVVLGQTELPAGSLARFDRRDGLAGLRGAAHCGAFAAVVVFGEPVQT